MSSKPAPRFFWAPTLWFLLAATAAVTWVQFGNSRLLGSWHGFLHSAIANRFAVSSFPPENPFFAGEPVPYYWFYHFAGYWFSQLLRLDLLHTFHLISGISLAVLILCCGLIGRACFSSKLAGAAIAWLVLAGVNPLGPGIAAAKHLVRGAPLTDHQTGPVETVFVNDRMADDLMTHPLLPALYVGSDWHYGQNIVWFFDIGARAPALAALMGLLYLLLKPSPGWGRYAAITAVSALLTAFSAVIGFGVVAALGAASLLIAAITRQFTPVALSIACGVGALLALPTYYHMFFRLSGGAGMALRYNVTIPVAMTAVNFALLGPLAMIGMRKAGLQAYILVLAAAMMLVIAIFVHLPEGNEHSLVNAAQCLLAVPAAIVAGSRARLWLLAFVPMTICTCVAFAYRSPMPVATAGQELVRLPVTGDLQRFYEWVRRETPADSIFVADPETPVKMSGNVAELPAMTRRTLFIDAPNYLTLPNRDFEVRTALARQLTRGEAPADANYFARFTRPVYVVTYSGERAGRLTATFGAPAFQQGMVAAYRFTK